MTTPIPPMCIICRHLKENQECDAFTGLIPEDIWFEHFDHRKPHEGDHDIQFELKPRIRRGVRDIVLGSYD